MPKRVDPVCYVTRRNGAWLLNWVGERTVDMPDEDRYTAASNLRVAKREAKEGAIEMGYEPPWRWVAAPYQHVLHGYDPDDDWRQGDAGPAE